MNIKLQNFIESINGVEIAVIGIGISNQPLIKYLVECGGIITACDRRSKEQLGDVYNELCELEVKFKLGDGYLNGLNHKIIFKTPGLRYDVPELIKAKKNGSKITSEIEMLIEFCPSKIIGVTGSDGKTTTTTIINKLLTKQGYKTWLGGNIGTPLATRVGEMHEEDYLVIELSSFQLHTMTKSPDVAVITNISPNHLDMHKDYQEYIDAKKNIMLYQNDNNKLVVNKDNEITNEIGKESKGKCLYFSRKENADVYLNGDIIYMGEKPVLNINDIKILGMHNVENYMAAIAAVGDIVDVDTIQSVAKEFGGVEHRIEFVRELNGVKYYNSSIDSSPNRTKNTLSVFEKKVIMISGGKDKGIPYDEIGPVIADNVKTLILIGATADKIEKALNDEIDKTGKGKDIKIIRVSTYKEAVNIAKENAQKGDYIVLSPASTSFDMFNNFEERGLLFKKLVNEL